MDGEREPTMSEDMPTLKHKHDDLKKDCDDISLCNLILKEISRAERDIDVVKAFLSNFCELKGIDYAAYIISSDSMAEVIYDYCSLSKTLSHKGIISEIGQSLFTRTSCYVNIKSERDFIKFLPSEINGSSQKSYYIKPLLIEDTPSWHLVFLNYTRPPEHLHNLKPIIDIFSEILSYRIQNIALLEEIKEKNIELEKEIKEKDKKLTLTDFELNLEIEDKRRITEKLQLFRDLLNETNVSIFVIDPYEERIIDVNTFACKELQYSYEELMHMNLPDIEETLSNKEAWQAIVEKLRERKGLVMEGINRRKDGSTFPVETTLRYIKRHDKDYIIAISHDITLQKEAERALKESEEKFRALAETTSSGIFITKDRFIYVNPATERITGYSRNELIGMPFYSIVHPEDREMVKNRGIARMKGSDVTNHYSFRIIRKDGTQRWIDFTANRILYEGTPAIIGTGYDITELKKREEELSLYKKIFDNSLDAIAVIDSEGRYLLQNEAHRRLIGYSDEELSGNTPALHLGEETFSEIYKKMQKEGFYRDVVLSRSSKGEERIIELVSFPVKNRQGEITHYVGIKRDVTERKKLEEELKRHTRELEKRVRERTEELQRAVNLMAGREVRMAELKEVIERLKEQLIKAGLQPAVDDPLSEEH